MKDRVTEEMLDEVDKLMKEENDEIDEEILKRIREDYRLNEIDIKLDELIKETDSIKEALKAKKFECRHCNQRFHDIIDSVNCEANCLIKLYSESKDFYPGI